MLLETEKATGMFSPTVSILLDFEEELPIKKDNDFIILKDNKELVRGEIEQILAHCPEQAYITLSERCIYDCIWQE